MITITSKVCQVFTLLVTLQWLCIAACMTGWLQNWLVHHPTVGSGTWCGTGLDEIMLESECSQLLCQPHHCL